MDEQRFPSPVGTSSILIDATRKWDYPPTSLPRKEFMDNALSRWAGGRATAADPEKAVVRVRAGLLERRSPSGCSSRR